MPMKKQRLGFHIILLGAPASGKDTQGKVLLEHFALKAIESGMFSRTLMHEDSPRGELFRKTVGKGKPAPVKFIKELLRESIEHRSDNHDLLFLGTPRLKPEIQFVKKLLTAAGEDFIAFYIRVPDREVMRRSLARTQTDVHDLYKVLDMQHLIEKRITWHKEQVMGMTVAYLQSIQKMHIINGTKSIPEVTAQIMRHIEKKQQQLLRVAKQEQGKRTTPRVQKRAVV